jgi:hypothetical protein
MSATDETARPVQAIDPRVGATGTLLAVALVAVLGMHATVRSGTTLQSATATVAPAERMPAAPVKIIGASPRSEACDGQVWPYIEGRCLVRAPAAAPPRAETTTAAPSPTAQPRTEAMAAAPPPAAPRVETTGAAPPARPPVAADDGVRSRSAASHLQLPPRRVAVSSPTDAWIDDDLAQPSYGTQSRRSGRRGYRNERNWRRRHALPFFFR